MGKLVRSAEDNADSLQKNISAIEESGFFRLYNDEDISHIRYYFSLGDTHILIPESIPCELASNLPIYKLPNTAEFILGLINVRGKLLPAFNLYSYIGDASACIYKYLLILNAGNKSVSFYVNEMPEVISLEQASAVKKTVASQLHSYITSVIETADKTLYEIDFDALFTELSKAA